MYVIFQVVLLKVNSVGGELFSLVFQDLQLGDGAVVDIGDMVEVKYTGWLLINNIQGQVNLFIWGFLCEVDDLLLYCICIVK